MKEDTGEREWVIRLKSGDKLAFEQIFLRYREKVYYFAIRYYNSPDDAENVVQDVFIKLWNERAGLKPELSLNNYIYTITKNHLFNLQRKKINEKAYRQYVMEHMAKTTNHENDFIYADLKEKIDKVIEKLPEQRRKVFQLGNIEGLSNKEVAEILRLSVRTIEVHKSLAIQTVKNAIKKIFS
ncbi:RNA polymerase sigma-70 factor [Lentimicrobium sp.]|jgi:RNA polymerase sigma-70 factor (ECF subfamily)|uniref:RNA polymerase sigma-70 factor n=1 Tax=Lentimicrobium sp. TaxID=2034841 RepID=UPI0025E3DB62|nr:RNA polymerase sigma-70 factor [Lentimicrobium sp.]MCO5255734.1 RNA polymerase sigma-70 factor [Lentimicrobium sp.]HPF63827.1 RNA polymerase sigma-70 factor [Lentimicrobium sp.]HPR26956.1 RNA polymerase sigma-70 factor [Lentimicrobium sp.]HRW68600.1 RNA polymerase sigma-70 factor [Lentimicrobium sp.]